MKKTIPPGGRASPRGIRYRGFFRELDLASIRPAGWLRRWLERQRDGLTGHLEHAGYPFNTPGWRQDPIRWKGRAIRSWWPYEQVAYWVDGMTRLGLLLEDARLLRKASRQLDRVLARPDPDGYLGPQALKRTTPQGRAERWPHAVLFRALMAGLPAGRRRPILRQLTRHYLSGTAKFSEWRNVCNVEIMLWLHGQTGDRRLLDLARRSLAGFHRRRPPAPASLRAMLSGARARDHGVNYCEISKLPAVLFLHTGNRTALRATVNAWRKLARDHALADGVPSSTEHFRGRAAHAGHETCVIADAAWSLGYLLMATGDAAYADWIENTVFNAAPGATMPDFKALQYFSSPNQIVADASANHHEHGFGWAHKSYRPNPATECCPGNVTRIVPNFAARMWMERPGRGLAATFYGPSAVTHRGCTISEETDYPFGESIRFTVRTRRPSTFSLFLRIPGWCRRPRLRINGEPFAGALKRGTFVEVRRTFRDGDRLELELPMDIRRERQPGGGLCIRRGPLLYALPIPARRRRDRHDKRSSDEFPAWNLRPAGPWNYALPKFSNVWKKAEVIFPNIGKKQAEFSKHWKKRAEIFQCLENPWAEPPIAIRVPAVRVPGWRARRLKVLRDKWHGARRGDFRMTPPLPSARTLARASRKVEWITLVPYGCTQLRIAIFPAT
ncbi:MAG TPA: glycoside hydrolase family 127 protein [Kiritimatiellia bacterium]|nr:glycoside hydrolase family 127 protein [Kiritimatiellia bacterium]HRZ12824.1 glycoside hydrolase family 127 protein [Kiritimatiellia bacterium]HSA18224.1 glycoside hydrolase family 127 protein [Kiritimatiellia bacterium]